MSQRVGILCPGPSFNPAEFSRAGYDVVIGVNRAATAIACDVWACGDLPAVLARAAEVMGNPSLLTSGNAVGEFPKNGFAWRGKTIEFESIADPLEPDWGWGQLTMTIAIAYAISIGAARIDVFGADWRGTLDWDGVAAGLTRGEDRWREERGLFERMQLCAKNRGGTLRRIRKPVFVSFFTAGTPYQREADELLRTLKQFRLEHDVVASPSAGDWCHNCAMKPGVIAAAMDRRPGWPVVWIDADARVRRDPVFFNDLDCDVAYYRFGDELLSGTLYFSGSERSRALVERWKKRCVQSPAVWDQVSLDQVLRDTVNSEINDPVNEKLRIGALPATYVQIFDIMKDAGESVIEHMQASRRLRDAV